MRTNTITRCVFDKVYLKFEVYLKCTKGLNYGDRFVKYIVSEWIALLEVGKILLFTND